MRFGYRELNDNTATGFRQFLFFMFALLVAVLFLPLIGGLWPLAVVAVWYWTHIIWEWAYYRQARGRGDPDAEAHALFDRYGHK